MAAMYATVATGGKAWKIIESWVGKDHPPTTTPPTKPYPEVPHLHIFLTPPGMGTPPPPWAACANA